MNVSIKSYREPKASNAQAVTIGKLVLYFSYETIVAFHPHDGKPVRVIENAWGPTTGRHLNVIDGGDKKTRLNAEDFQTALDETLANIAD